MVDYSRLFSFIQQLRGSYSEKKNLEFHNLSEILSNQVKSLSETVSSEVPENWMTRLGLQDLADHMIDCLDTAGRFEKSITELSKASLFADPSKEDFYPLLNGYVNTVVRIFNSYLDKVYEKLQEMSSDYAEEDYEAAYDEAEADYEDDEGSYFYLDEDDVIEDIERLV